MHPAHDLRGQVHDQTLMFVAEICSLCSQKSIDEFEALLYETKYMSMTYEISAFLRDSFVFWGRFPGLHKGDFPANLLGGIKPLRPCNEVM